MTRYLLDTNTVSDLIKGHPVVARHVVAVPMVSVCISSITQSELLFGLAKRPKANRLNNAVREFLLCIEVFAWDSVAAQNYGTVRADMECRGRILAPLGPADCYPRPGSGRDIGDQRPGVPSGGRFVGRGLDGLSEVNNRRF